MTVTENSCRVDLSHAPEHGSQSVDKVLLMNYKYKHAFLRGIESS